MTARKSLERHDRVRGVRHCRDLARNALRRGAEVLVLHERTDSLTHRWRAQFAGEQPDSSPGRNHALGVEELVGALRDEKEGQAERESSHGRARSAVSDGDGALREHQILWYEPANLDMVRLRTEHIRVVLLTDGDDDAEFLSA